MDPLAMQRALARKRNGQELAESEIRGLIEAYVAGDVSDAQMAALLMAVCLRGLSSAETTALTLAMAASGRRLDLSAIPGIKVDKHSTGGVGDKTTLVVAPLVAAAGLPVVKLAGRSLGHTGGTIDKLEAIPGFRTDLTPEEMIAQVKRIGVALAAQSAELVPADRKLYALRDLTGTVECLPLIAASVMSKKLAAGADAIVLDVKVGRGAFMTNAAEARRLAKAMVEIGRKAGRNVTALLTRMDQPLGRAIGDALEVREAIETLHGRGPEDLTELCLTLGAEMLLLGGKAKSRRAAIALLRKLVSSGDALAKFRQLAEAQGGDLQFVDQPELLIGHLGPNLLLAQEAGFVSEIDARALGEIVHDLARRADGSRDHGAGMLLSAKCGDPLTAGQPLAEIHCAPVEFADDLRRRLSGAFRISPAPPKRPKLILGRVEQ